MKNTLFVRPGAWRPHYPWEQIVWIHPPWGNDDFVWLDFPEALFSDQGLLYLSHDNPAFPTAFGKLPAAEWQSDGAVLHYARTLPNGVAIRGSVWHDGVHTVSLRLAVTNGSDKIMTGIVMQTCLNMRAHAALRAPHLRHSYLHNATAGWLPLEQAAGARANGRYRYGWRGGPPVADRPLIACVGADRQHAVAFTWGTATHSLIANPDHPCIHADPALPDLLPGVTGVVEGELYFAENGLGEIDACYGGVYE